MQSAILQICALFHSFPADLLLGCFPVIPMLRYLSARLTVTILLVRTVGAIYLVIAHPGLRDALARAALEFRFVARYRSFFSIQYFRLTTFYRIGSVQLGRLEFHVLRMLMNIIRKDKLRCIYTLVCIEISIFFANVIDKMLVSETSNIRRKASVF